MLNDLIYQLRFPTPKAVEIHLHEREDLVLVTARVTCDVGIALKPARPRWHGRA
jgi:hypothetical protein